MAATQRRLDGRLKAKIRSKTAKCRPYDDQSQIKVNLETRAKLDIQRQIREGTLELAASYVLIAENNANPFDIKRNDINSFINQYTKVFVDIQSQKEINSLSSMIMQTGVKKLDACHIACAIIAKCDFFLTTDKRILKYNTDIIRIVNPIEFISETE